MSEAVVCFLPKVEESAASGEAYAGAGELARLIGRASTPLAGVVADGNLIGILQETGTIGGIMNNERL
jgi:hypothetical protein